jgi:hypothetical protein
MYTCPECDTEINQGSDVCPACGADLASRGGSGSGASGDGGSRKPNWKKTAIVLAVLVAAIWGLMWFALGLRQPGRHAASEALARASLTQVRQALQSYETAEGHYPDSLDELGEQAAAVHAAAQAARSAGYDLQYLPGTPGFDGRVHAFGLLARPLNYGSRDFFIDESGVIRANREGRPATAEDPPV